MVQVFLFGTPRIEHNGTTIPLRRTKALAMVAYLALAAKPQERDTLAALLWPELDEASARNNLRRELSLLKSTLHEELLVADRLQIGWNGQGTTSVDVVTFGEQIASSKQHNHATGLCAACAEALTAATRLYTEDFLAGFNLPDCPAFDDWQFFQREELRQQLAEALQSLVDWHSQANDYGPAITFARRWVALDPLDEPAQRKLIWMYAQSGQLAAALRQYEECARLLAKELGAEPDAETTALYTQIRSREFVRPEEGESRKQPPGNSRPEPPVPTVARRSPRAAQQLPPTAPLVGRQRELADILRRLTDRACRLLTLTGPGGIGKTRLALQVAQTLAEEWTDEETLVDGVLFVHLATISSPEAIASAFAAAAGFDFYPNTPPKQQVLDYLRDKRMLVVLDNFEHLLEEAAFVGEILATAPHLRLLVTSRLALNVRDEWYHPIEGLSFPTEEEVADVAELGRFDAIRLFEQHARRVRNDFALSRERTHVVRLCRIVEGSPLGIELAASWLKVLSIEQVVVALERGLDILTSRDTNIPERHRSMRAVLEESWRLLSADEQRTLARLAVFPGSFSAAAAEAVAGASLVVLAMLAEESLLRTTLDTGDFYLQELPRQFAAEKLTASLEEATIRQRHSAYYLDLLGKWGKGFLRGEHRNLLNESRNQTENIRAAWRWAVEECDIEAIEQALEPLFHLYVSSGQYQEGLADFSSAATQVAAFDALAPHRHLQMLHTRLVARRGAFRYALGDHHAASVDLQESLGAAQTLGLQHEKVFILNLLGQIASWNGDYDASRQLLLESLTLSREIGDASGTATALEKLAEVIADLGEYEEAKELGLESLAISRELRRLDGIAHALDRIGFITFCLGEYGESAAYFRESFAIFDSINHMLGRGLTLGALGIVTWALGGAEARAYFEQSLEIFRAIGHQRHSVERLIDLSHAASDAGEYVEAQRYAEEGLMIARRIGSPLYASVTMCCLGRATSELRGFQAGMGYLLEALKIASATHIPLAGIEILYYIAVLVAKESKQGDLSGSARVQKRLQALTLLEIAISHPTIWHVTKTKAISLRADLERDLPAELAANARDRGRQLDWEAGSSVLFTALDQPPPVEAQLVPNNLPPQPTPFVGREYELAGLQSYIDSPDARLITVIGPGGIGKTRLVLGAAESYLRPSADPYRSRVAIFPDGIFFVPLAMISGVVQILPAIADALGLHLGGGEHQPDPLEQLYSYLHDKQLLLVIDNIEHVLEGVELLSGLLAAAPKITLLVTSREVLNLAEEWLYPIEGLSVPLGAAPEQLASSDAVQLFAERARRVRPSFTLDANGPAVAHICRLVGGMPLAIELAASWVRTLSCKAIAEQVGRNLSFLETNQRSIPQRHRSVRAIFDHSWAQLNPIEQDVFMRLSIFRGSFTFAAAERIAGASLQLLATFRDKSLVQSGPDERYQLHNLLRQYADGHLQANTDTAQAVQQAYDSFYLTFLAERHADLVSRNQVRAVDEISAEIEEIRVVWPRAVVQSDLEQLHLAAGSLGIYCDIRGRYAELRRALAPLAERLRAAPPSRSRDAFLAVVLIYLGWAFIRTGLLSEARDAFEQSERITTEQGIEPQQGVATDPLLGLGVLALIQGDYARAAELGEAARKRSEAHQHHINLPYAWYVLTNAALAQGQLDAAQQYAQQAYEAGQASGDEWFLAYGLNELGNCARALGALEEARQYYVESYRLRERFHDREGMALALALLGKVALIGGAYADARQQYQRSLAIYREIGDRGGLATALHGLGMAESALGDDLLGRKLLGEALEIAVVMEYTPLALTAATGIAEVLLRTEQPEPAATLLTVLVRYPGNDREIHEQAQRLLSLCESLLAPAAFAAARQRADGQTLADLVVEFHPQTSAAREAHRPLAIDKQDDESSPVPREPAPVEPLTERERDVLGLIAAGLSNQAIADQLVLSVGTVKWYTGQIYGKLGVQTRTQAIARAHGLRLLD